jgi:hypothetical protein
MRFTHCLGSSSLDDKEWETGMGVQVRNTPYWRSTCRGEGVRGEGRRWQEKRFSWGGVSSLRWAASWSLGDSRAEKCVSELLPPRDRELALVLGCWLQLGQKGNFLVGWLSLAEDNSLVKSEQPKLTAPWGWVHWPEKRQMAAPTAISDSWKLWWWYCLATVSLATASLAWHQRLSPKVQAFFLVSHCHSMSEAWLLGAWFKTLSKSYYLQGTF